MQITYNIIWNVRRMIELNEVARWCITAYTSASSLVFDVTTTGYRMISYYYSVDTNVYDILMTFSDNQSTFEDSVQTTTKRQPSARGTALVTNSLLYQIYGTLSDYWFHTMVVTKSTICKTKIRVTLLACTNHQSNPKSKSDGGHGILDIAIQSQSS